MRKREDKRKWEEEEREQKKKGPCPDGKHMLM